MFTDFAAFFSLILALCFAIGTGYAGSLDELAIYDHALAPARVVAHYMLGKPK